MEGGEERSQDASVAGRGRSLSLPNWKFGSFKRIFDRKSKMPFVGPACLYPSYPGQMAVAVRTIMVMPRPNLTTMPRKRPTKAPLAAVTA